jgi:hypothetical protein
VKIHGIPENPLSLDLLQNPKGSTPPFFLICINVNTRYAYAYPLGGKSTAEILPKLQEFVNQAGNVVKIVADKEAAWNGDEITNWLKSKGIDSKLIEDQQHSALGIIDRFIRTLRTMLYRENEERVFTPEKMKELLGKYNESLHKGTNMTPKDMEGDTEKQKRYIIEKIYEQERREKISDYNLHVGTYCRYIIPRVLMEKNRYRVSTGVVKITGRDGKGYLCMAADGSVRTLQRWRLFPVGDQIPPDMTLERTFGKRNGIIDRIVGKRGNKYKVEWRLPNGNHQAWERRANILMQNNGQRLIDDWKRAH